MQQKLFQNSFTQEGRTSENNIEKFLQQSHSKILKERQLRYTFNLKGKPNFLTIIYHITQDLNKTTSEIFFCMLQFIFAFHSRTSTRKYICFSCFFYFIAFSNTSLATSITDVRGAWSNEGCKISEGQELEGFLICECNHLTNFALLMDVSNTRHDSFALSIVTWIGCIISMFGLVITIITHLCFK